ncbi:MAG: GNAT family N-acetyltransferase [Hyphomonadaceae bacterium]
MRVSLNTNRLRLRPLQSQDAAPIARYTSDEGVARMVCAIPRPNPVIAVEGWMLLLKARAPLKEEFVYALEREGEGLIGCIGAHRRPEGYELGYWLGRPFWGQGYATEAVSAFVSETRALGPLGAAHYVDNPASGRVLQKAGFVYTGAVERRFSLARGEKAEARIMRQEAQRAAA